MLHLLLFLPWPSLLSPSVLSPHLSPFLPPLKLTALTDHSHHSPPSSSSSSRYPSSSAMKSQVQDRFHEFYHTWVCKLEEILHPLLQLSKQRSEMAVEINDHDVQHLVNTVTSHIKQYYTVKWAEAREDVLPFFAPTWLTPLENACSWITGWKPSTAFRVVRSHIGMNEEQVWRVEKLRMRMRMEEEKVEREMERLQVAMADNKMVELAKLSSRADSGGVAAAAQVEVALKGVLGGLENAMKGADCVRLKTLKGVLDVLTPLQCVEFLAAFLALQLRLRQWERKKTDILHAPKLNERRQVIN